MGLMDRVKGAAGSAMDLGGTAVGKLDELLDDYKKALAVLGKFEFTVAKFDVEMGLLPEIRTAVTGSVAGIRADDLRKMADEHKDNKLAEAMLNGLATAKAFSERIELKSSAVIIDVKLGLPPSIAVRFV